MWKRSVNGRELTFYLAGINNQNFLMRDHETGSYWQQVSGLAVSGPMKGAALELVSTDEVSFGLWRSEHPDGQVMMGRPEWKDDYERGWESDLQRLPTVIKTAGTPLTERETVLGMELNGAAKAYPLAEVLKQQVIHDRVGGEPVVLLAGPDGRSVRAFRSKSRELFRRSGETWALMDSASGDSIDFRGCDSKGECMEPVGLLKDFWFDWRQYHPQSAVYQKR